MKKLLIFIYIITLCACSVTSNEETISTPLTAPTQTLNKPTYGEIYAHITCERIGLDKDIYYGDEEAILRKRLGQYSNSHLFGEGNTILIAGHNGTHFKAIHKIELRFMIL